MLLAVHEINVHAHHSSDTEGEGGLARETRGDSEATLNRGERGPLPQTLSPIFRVSEASSDLCICLSEPSEDDECTEDLPVTCNRQRCSTCGFVDSVGDGVV